MYVISSYLTYLINLPSGINGHLNFAEETHACTANILVMHRSFFVSSNLGAVLDYMLFNIRIFLGFK